MIRGPKEKKERALGQALQLKGKRCASPKCALVRRPYRPGQHGKSRQRALSDFGRQIREKQKFKLSYGLDERNLRELVHRAEKKSGSTVTRILELLERRLDNVVFRLGFAPSRAAARQLVVHGHIFVNKKRVRSPGYEVRAQDVISIRKESLEHVNFKDLKEALKKYDVPSWLQLDPEKLEGRVLSNEPNTVAPFEINLLVESFSS